MALLHLLGAVLFLGAPLGSHASRDDSEVEALALFARGAAAKVSSQLTALASTKTARHHQNEHALVVVKTPKDCKAACVTKADANTALSGPAKSRATDLCKHRCEEEASATEPSALPLDTVETDSYVAVVAAAKRNPKEEAMTCKNNPALQKPDPEARGRTAFHLNHAEDKVYMDCMKELVDKVDKNLFSKLTGKAKEQIAAAVKYAKTPEGQLLAIKTAKTVAGITMFVVSVACPPAAAIGLGLGIGLNVFFSGLEAAQAINAGASAQQAAGMFFFNVGKGLTMSLIGLPIGDLNDFVTAGYTAASYADMLCGMMGDVKAGLDTSLDTEQAPDVGFMAEGASYAKCFGAMNSTASIAIIPQVEMETL